MKPVLIMVTLLLAAPFGTLTHAEQNKTPDPVSDYASRPAPPISAEARRDMEVKLSEARTRYEAEPNQPDTVIWYGRRLGYLGRFTEAIEVYSIRNQKVSPRRPALSPSRSPLHHLTKI